MQAEFGRARADNYASAIAAAPAARLAELDALESALDALLLEPCRTMVDLGSGHGFATERLLRHLAPDGVIHCADTSEFMTRHSVANPRCQVLLGPLDRMPLEPASVNVCVSLASFHHFTHKTRVLQEMRRVLAAGGYTVIADVNHGTPPQRFFDNVVRWHCATGHEFDFLDGRLTRAFAERADLEYVSSAIVDTPWRFESAACMARYVRELMSLDIDHCELGDAIREWLRPEIDQATGNVTLPWTLGIHVLRRDA